MNVGIEISDEREREKLIDKIKKLQTKGQDSGVTEAEAEVYLAAVARLMAEHGVHDDDLLRAGIGTDAIAKKGVHVSINKAHPATLALAAIGMMTGTSIGMRVRREFTKGPPGRWEETGYLTIAGRPSDIKIADYLYDTIRNMVDAAWTAEHERRLEKTKEAMVKDRAMLGAWHVDNMPVEYWADRFGLGVGNRPRRSFGFGMAQALGKRIAAMATRAADRDLARDAWEKQKKTPAKEFPRPKLDAGAFHSGLDEGETANLGMGVAAAQRDVKVLR